MEENAKTQLKQYLKSYIESTTRKAPTGGYICPFCGSGTGPNKTGALSVSTKTNTFTCFSCGKRGDIFEYYQELNNVNFQTAVYELGKLYNVDTGASQTGAPFHGTKKREEKGLAVDHTEFIKKAHDNIGKTEYWKKRGLSLETVNKFNVGYVEAWRHSKTPKAPLTPRLIVPNSSGGYLARDVRDDITPQVKRFDKQKEAPQGLFNAHAIEGEPTVIYVVEGEIDAMSMYEVGATAIGLGSTANKQQLVTLVQNRGRAHTYLLALDNDESGQSTQTWLKETLRRDGIAVYEHCPFTGYITPGASDEKEPKDPNEALIRDRERLASQAIKTLEEFETWKQEGEPQEQASKRVQYICEHSSAIYALQYLNNAGLARDTISTGYSVLDEKLDGGLTEGLYVIGGVSSIGKTTFVLQMADQIAKQGKSVLVFSLEMSRSELIAKSLSRLTAKHSKRLYEERRGRKGNSNDAYRHAQRVKDFRNINTFQMTEQEVLRLATTEYVGNGDYSDGIGPHIFIEEGEGDIGVKEIASTVKQFRDAMSEEPVIVIDYLQMLAPYNEKYSDKQNIDTNVRELKRLSRNIKAPVICISSFNRASYNDEVSMLSFKESGGIEYTSDVLIGLQLAGVGEPGFKEKEAKAKTPREVELIILKNRNGQTGSKIKYDYTAMFNIYEEIGEVRARETKPSTN